VGRLVHVVYGILDVAPSGYEVRAVKLLALACAGLLAAAIGAGTLADSVRSSPPLTLGGYRVLAADFHIHPLPLSAAALAPWDIVLEARRQGLDAIAITGHDDVWSAKTGRWVSRLVGGPTVLVGEEIISPEHHIIGVGLTTAVSWRLSAFDAISQIHQQGGVAIAAHPMASFWPGYPEAALRILDAAEIMQPIAYAKPRAAEMREFFGRGRFTAIGSTDFHGLGPIGFCRTYVFAREDSDTAILEALRQGHTVVYDGEGRAWGDPTLIRLAEDAHVRDREPQSPPGGVSLLSRTCGILGLIAAAFLLQGHRNPAE
jgi:hypothetical protein